MKARPIRTNAELFAAHKAGEYVEFNANASHSYDARKNSPGWKHVTPNELVDNTYTGWWPEGAQCKAGGYLWRAWPKEE